MRKKYSDKSIKRSLNLLKLGWFFRNFLLIVPVIVLIYTQKGITVGDFFLIQGIFRLAAFLFEIPSGYLSDCFSRKRIMILGAIFLVFGFTTLGLAYGFWGLVLGEALLGIADSLFSGTMEAYTYDLLKRNNSQKNFLKEFGNITTCGGVASFLSVIFGGILYAHIGGNWLMFMMAAFMLLVIIIFLFLPELTEVKRVVKHKQAITDAVSITCRTLKNPRLRNFIFFPSLFASFTVVLVWIMQPIMQDVNIPVSLFGFFTAINQLFVILYSKYAYKICEKFGEIKTSVITIFAIIIGATLGLLVTHINTMFIIYIACVIMEMVPAIRILNRLQYNTLIHHCIKSTERGTVLSTRAMVSTVFGAIFLIIAKFVMDNFGINATLIWILLMTTLLILSLKTVSKYIK